MNQALEKMNGIKSRLINQKAAIERALPDIISSDKMISVALSSLRKTPKLLDCEPASFVGAIVQCSQLGLMPDGVTGEAHLIPFKKECNLIIGYKGLIKLVLNSPEMAKFDMRCVYEGDEFYYEFGLEEKLRHIPKGKSSKLTHVYAIATTTIGVKSFDVMSKEDVDNHVKKVKNGDNPVWKDHYDAMAMKTVARRLCKILPLTMIAQKAIGLDEEGEVKSQKNHIHATSAEETINTDYKEVKEEERKVATEKKAEVVDKAFSQVQ